MADKTKIAWCDSTINPTTGCDGCELKIPDKPGTCYASKIHVERLALSNPQAYAPDFHEVRLAPGRMAKAAAWSDLTGTPRPDKPWLEGMPRIIFVGDLGDIFSADVPFEYLRDEVLAAAISRQGSRHIWIWLTKQPGRMLAFQQWTGEALPDNVWPATSVTRQKNVSRIDELARVKAKTRLVSCEPMLEAIDFGARLGPHCPWGCGPIGWNLVCGECEWCGDPTFRVSGLILGGESGPDARWCKLAWIRDAVRQCREAGVAPFVKQLGSQAIDDEGLWIMNVAGMRLGEDGLWRSTTAEDMRRDPKHEDWADWPKDLRIREMPR